MDQDHFGAHGWVRIAGAFSADQAAVMREVTWHALERVGILHDNPTTWIKHARTSLQQLEERSGVPALLAASGRSPRSAGSAAAKPGG